MSVVSREVKITLPISYKSCDSFLFCYRARLLIEQRQKEKEEAEKQVRVEAVGYSL